MTCSSDKDAKDIVDEIVQLFLQEQRELARYGCLAATG